MSTTERKRSLSAAREDAEAFRALWPSHCFERWEIAGSVRRGKPEVGDVEHVVIPIQGEVPGAGLFGEMKNLLWHRLDELVKAGTVSQHLYTSRKSDGSESVAPRWGERYRGIDFRGFNHEIFIADADNFGSVLTIRTGPAEFSQKLVTTMQTRGYFNRRGYVWNRRDWNCPCGWTGAMPGTISADRLPPKHGLVWFAGTAEELVYVCPNCDHFDAVNPAKVPVPNEAEFFNVCGMQWIPPELRR